MLKLLLQVFFLIIICFSTGTCQYYDISWKKDVPTLSVGIGLTALGSIVQNKADKASLSDINALRGEDLIFLDRGAVNNLSGTAQDISDIFLYSSIAFPVVTFASNKCRANTGAIIVMTAEVALLTSGVTSIVKGIAQRYRPFNYNPDVEELVKLGNSSRKSFISGHTSSVAALTFLTARIVTDLHPETKHKKLIWGTAIVLPAVIGTLRVQAGKHFPTDVIGGYVVGAAIGYLIPKLHLSNNENINISTVGLSGLNLSVNF